MAKHRRTEANGRSAQEQFIALPYNMVKSDAWRSLSGSALKTLIELKSRFNGRNNGQLCLSYADASQKLRLGHATIGKAFKELQAKGFLRLVKRGHWYGRKATEWAITDKQWQGNPPTNDWKHLRIAGNQKTEVAPNTEHIQP
ncbi:MAG: hypothetical protein WC464_07340 [Bdellovibrionales bacterium]